MSYRNNALVKTESHQNIWTWWNSFCWFFRFRSYDRSLKFADRRKKDREPQKITVKLVQKWIAKGISKSKGEFDIHIGYSVDKIPNKTFYLYNDLYEILKSLGYSLFNSEEEEESLRKINILREIIDVDSAIEKLNKAIPGTTFKSVPDFKYFYPR